MITIFDTETTNLVKPEGNDLAVQPHMVEIYAIQVDDKGEIILELDTLVKAPVPSTEAAFRAHRLTQNDLKDAPTFIEIYPKVADVFFGSHTCVGHNLTFDMWMLIYELRRIGKEHKFPYPPIWYCTIEQSMHLRGHRLKNSELYKIATGKELEGAHQAKNDVMATYESYLWLKEQGRK